MEKKAYIFDTHALKEIAACIHDKGFAVVKNVFSPDEMNDVAKELPLAIEKESQFHGTTKHQAYGMLLACPIYGGSFISILENPTFWSPFNQIMGEEAIIYVYTSSSLPPQGTNFSKRIHVDRPSLEKNRIEAMGALICINEFTKDNGGTWVLPGSQNTYEPPEEASFYKNAIQIEAPEGSVLYFNLRLWHSGADNNTNEWRHCLGIGMVKPQLKQRIDLPRAIPEVFTKNMSKMVKQKLGYFAQPPTSLAEFYAPDEEKTYRAPSAWNKNQRA